MSTKKEKHRRSIVKCSTWRLVAFVDTVVLSLVFTGSIGSAFAIGGIEIATKSTLYYVHERLWLTIASKLNQSSLFHFDTSVDSAFCSGFKTMSWRVIGSIDTLIIALVITGDLAASTSIGIAEIFTKITLYYLHERIWARIGWGKVTPPPSQLQLPQKNPGLSDTIAQA